MTLLEQAIQARRAGLLESWYSALSLAEQRQFVADLEKAAGEHITLSQYRALKDATLPPAPRHVKRIGDIEVEVTPWTPGAKRKE